MISHKHKCIFVHIPKTAGTSINSFFHPGVSFHYKNPDYDRLFGWCPKRKLHMQHATAKQLLETELITNEQWDTYFKFTFVRNPWDRAYSDYLFIKKFANIEGSFKEYIERKGNFRKIFTDKSSINYLGDHLIPQSDFFEKEGKHSLNFIGRFENFTNDINFVLNSLSIKEDFNLHENSSNRKKNYSLFYTNSNKRLVERKYQTDIDSFNYSFDDKRMGLHQLKKIF